MNTNMRKPLKRLLAMALSFAMLLSILPMTAFAESGASAIGVSGEIICFEPLTEAVAKQAVPLGTSLNKLNLPESLMATVRVATATDAAVPAQADGKPEPSAEAFETTEMTIPVPAEWVSTPDYDGDTAGVYTFAAEITGYTLSAEPPVITITVGEGALGRAALADAVVCIVNGVEYTDSDSAIQNAFANGGTLKLLQNISYDAPVSLAQAKTLTINLNACKLTINNGLTINISSVLMLEGEQLGMAELNVNNTNSMMPAIDLQTLSRANVSNLSSTAHYGALLSYQCSLTVSGNVYANYTGVRFASTSCSLNIGGNLTVLNASYGIDSRQYQSFNNISIGGDIIVTGSNPAVGVYATDSPTNINGGIYMEGGTGSTAIMMANEAYKYSLGQGVYNSGTGYFDYLNSYFLNSRVSVKGYALTVAAGAGGTATTGATGTYEGGRKIGLAATPSAHHTFAGWTSSDGGTFVNSANASTTFVMQAASTTVTANFTHYNTAPARKSSVPAAASANVTYGGAYTLNLSDIFTDADGDPLAYKVSINGAAAIGAAEFYGFTPASAGTSTLTFTAYDGYAYSTDSYTVTLTVDKKTPEAADLTYQLAAKTYSGLAQPLSVTGPAGLGAITVKYDGSATQPKNVGTYAVTASITEGTNFEAATADIFLGNYTINKANLTVTDASEKTYDGTTDMTGITLTFDGLLNGESLTLGTDYTVTGAQFDNADAGANKTITGTVALTTTAKAQNYALANRTLNLTGQIISKAAALAGVNRTLNAVIHHAQDYEFDLTTLLPVIGSPRTLGTVTYSIKNTADTGNVLGALGYTSGNTLTIPVQLVSDANKTAVITVTVKSTNYADFDTDITVTTVDTIPLTVAGLTVDSKTYDGTTAAVLNGTATLVADHVQPGDAVSLSGAPSAAFADANAEPDKVVTVTGLSLAGADAHKYRLDLSGFTGTITAKPLTAAMLTVAGGPFTYTGTAQAPAVTVQDGDTPLVLNADYENVVYSNNTDAGTAGVSVTGRGNYQGTTSKAFTIGKAPLTIAGGTIAAKAYDGTTDAVITTVTFSGMQNGETLTLGTDYTVSGATFDSASVGSGKTVTATAALNNTAKANNYTLANASLTLTGRTIQKGTVADVTFDIPVATNLAKDYTLSYQEFASILADLTGKAFGTVSYNLTSVENTDGVLAALLPTGPLTFPATMHVAGIADAGKKATLIGTVTSANYNDFTVTAGIETVDRIPVVISGLIMTGGIYNGSFYAYSGTPLFASGLSGDPVSIPEFDVVYTSTDSGGYSSSSAPQNAGAYQLTISVSNSNPGYTGSKSYAFTITKRPIEVKAEDKVAKVGEQLPAVTVSYSGFVGTDSKDNALSTQAVTQHTAANTQTAGTFPITFATNAVLNAGIGANYTLDHQIGNLIVTNLATYTITASAGANGTISPSGTVAVTGGDNKTFTIVANAGYGISTVTIDGVNQGAINTYTFSNVAGNHTINVVFARNNGGDDYIHRVMTDSATSIMISGNISEDAVLTVSSLSLGSDAASDAIRQRMKDEDYVFLLGKNISLSGGFSGTLTISLPVGAQYNGETVTILHAKQDGTLETFTVVVQDGKATFSVTSLSPFAAFIKDGLDDIPKTGDDSSPWVWWLLCGVSAAGIGLITALHALGKRRKLYGR